MTVANYDVGDLIRLGNSAGLNDDGSIRNPFADITGTATDPTAVTLEVRKPDGTSLDYGWPTLGTNDGLLTKDATGRFYWDLLLTTAGDWEWRLTGTGTVSTSESGTLHVRWSDFP